MRRGWCPGLFQPMASGDGLLVRVKPPLGRVTAAQMRALAEAARRHGNGCVGVTGRGNLQVRGLRDATVAPFAEAMVACGLALGDGRAERRRRVIVSPLGDGAAAIERAMLEDAALDALPDKFAVLVGGGCAADIIVRDSHVWVAGSEQAAFVAEPGAAVVRLAHVLLARGGARMRDLVDAVGAAAIFAAAGLVADRVIPEDRCGRLGRVAPGMVAAGLWCGETDAGELARLAGVAERYGDGTIWVAPWRALVFGGVADVAGLRDALGTDLIFDAADPRFLVTACVGRPRCAQASVDARGEALALTSLGLRIHVSGCAKGCGRPSASDVILFGRAGAYDVFAADDTVAPALRNVDPALLSEWIPKALPLAGSRGRAPGLPS